MQKVAINLVIAVDDPEEGIPVHVQQGVYLEMLLEVAASADIREMVQAAFQNALDEFAESIEDRERGKLPILFVHEEKGTTKLN